jgi:micrococcal nuclease
MPIAMLARLALAVAALGSCAAARPPVPGPSAECLVGRVVDGDTFYCRDGRKVRLLGIDSPERGQGAAGRLARRALERLMPVDRLVRLESDVTATDRYGRVLAYVWIGATLVNEVMVRDGWAVRYTVPPDAKYADRIARAQKEARARRAGLWVSGGFECLLSASRRRECRSAP